MSEEIPKIQQHLRLPFQICTLDNIFDESDLSKFDQIISSSDKKVQHFTSSPFKNGKITLPEISNLIWGKISNHLPDIWVDSDGVRWKFITTANIVMFAEVHSNQQFGIHSDTGYVYEQDGNLRSTHTLLIYINDDFEGGSTQFLDKSFKKTVDIKPLVNRSLIFDIRLFHEGRPVVKGIKRWIGTEIVSLKL